MEAAPVVRPQGLCVQSLCLQAARRTTHARSLLSVCFYMAKIFSFKGFFSFFSLPFMTKSMSFMAWNTLCCTFGKKFTLTARNSSPSSPPRKKIHPRKKKLPNNRGLNFLLNMLPSGSEARWLIYSFSLEGIQMKGPDCSSIMNLHWLYISSKVSPWTIAVEKK